MIIIRADLEELVTAVTAASPNPYGHLWEHACHLSLSLALSVSRTRLLTGVCTSQLIAYGCTKPQALLKYSMHGMSVCFYES